MKQLKSSPVICFLSLVLVAIVYGGIMSAAEWVVVQNKEGQIEISFPQPPAEMSFDLPFLNSPRLGNVHVYCTEFEKNSFILCSLKEEKSAQDFLNPAVFKQIFENKLAPHIFYDPTVLKESTAFDTKPTKIHGVPALLFEMHYVDAGTGRRLRGIALVKNEQLHTLFSVAEEVHFDEKLYDRFFNSLSIEEESEVQHPSK